jgi:hypothetical protein
MENYFEILPEHKRSYLYWVFAPVVAHWVSCMTGLFGLIAFPIFVTVSYYLFFRMQSCFTRPKIWFATIPLILVVWLKWGPHVDYSTSSGIVNGVIAYYVCQLVNTFFISSMGDQNAVDSSVGWFLGHLTAMVIWLILYKTFVGVFFTLSGAASGFALWVFYPLISIVANSVSGFLVFRRYSDYF